MPIYSHSKLSIYENCPQQFKLRYIDRIELPESKEGIEAFLGSRVHEALEKLHKELILTKVNSLDEIHDYKASGTLPSQDKLDNDRQLALYQIGLKEKFKDVKDVRLIWHYLL